jgi:uncharacterized protein
MHVLQGFLDKLGMTYNFMPTKKVYVVGMHCVSCERLLEEELAKVSGVKKVRADRRKGIVELNWEKEEPSFSEIKKITEKFDYGAFEDESDAGQKGKNNSIEWLKAALIIVVIFFFYRLLQKSGIIESVKIGNNQLDFGVSFLVGLVASVSSCLAVVGGVIIAFSEKYRTEGSRFFETAVRPNLFFHFGRLSTFFVLGGFLGLIGGQINISGNFVAIFTIIVAIIMGLLGLNILGFLPPISNFGVKMPKKFTGKWGKLKESKHKFAPVILGGLTFFLPCGFTQSMQIFALTSGSFWVGGLSLFLFAFGTVPALLFLGIATSWTRSKKIAVFQKVAGAIIVFFAIYTLQSGLALRGVKTDVLTTKKEQSASNSNLSQNENISGETQTINMKITASGFQPNIIKIKKGIPVRWVIDGQAVTSCASKIIIPSLNISKSIASGENIINFTPTAVGEIPFSCWMGMVRGKFIVE